MRPGSTTERGYGWRHQQARAKALRALQDGDACVRCGGPMYRADSKNLDLDHTEDRAAYRGLAHRSCNRQAGQAVAVANRMKSAASTVINSRVW